MCFFVAKLRGKLRAVFFFLEYFRGKGHSTRLRFVLIIISAISAINETTAIYAITETA